MCVISFQGYGVICPIQVNTFVQLLWKQSEAFFLITRTHLPFSSSPVTFPSLSVSFSYLASTLCAPFWDSLSVVTWSDVPQFPFHWFICVLFRISENGAVETKGVFVWELANLLPRGLLHQLLGMTALCNLAAVGPYKAKGLNTGRKRRKKEVHWSLFIC